MKNVLSTLTDLHAQYPLLLRFTRAASYGVIVSLLLGYSALALLNVALDANEAIRFAALAMLCGKALKGLPGYLARIPDHHVTIRIFLRDSYRQFWRFSKLA